MVYGSQEEDFAIEIQRLASTNQYPIQIIPFESSTAPRPSQLSDLGLHLDTTTEVSLDSPSMVMFSSGTTSGKPKGIMHSRRFFNRPYRLPPQAVFLTLTDPFHLMSHLNAMIAPILGGCQMKIIDRVDAPAEVWEQLRSGRVHAFSALPNHWEDMAWYYRNKIHPMPEEVREGYLQGAQKVLYPYVTATVAPASLFRFWSEDLKRPLLNAFGTTELGGLAISTSMDTVSKHHVRPFYCTYILLATANGHRKEMHWQTSALCHSQTVQRRPWRAVDQVSYGHVRVRIVQTHLERYTIADQLT